MYGIVGCLAVAIVLASYAYWKGRTGWHWFVLTVCAFATIWISTIVALDLAGINIPFSSGRLALFVGVLAGIVIMIILVSVPQRVRRHGVRNPRPSSELTHNRSV